jgi:hypothetical protein
MITMTLKQWFFFFATIAALTMMSLMVYDLTIIAGTVGTCH